MKKPVLVTGASGKLGAYVVRALVKVGRPVVAWSGSRRGRLDGVELCPVDLAEPSLEEAALDLGCTPFDAFRSVTLPIITPAVISGWLLAFTLSLDDLVIASFTAGPSSTTLPIRIFSSVRLGVSPEINALSTIMISIVAVGVVSASLVSKRAIIRQRQEELAGVRA